MRKAFGAVFIVLCLLGLTPWVMGYWTKSSIERLFKSLPQDFPLHVSIVSYHVGWMNSQAVLKLSNPQLPASDTILLNATIQHGPLLLEVNQQTKTSDWHFGRGFIHGHFVFSQAARRHLQQLFKQVPTIKMHSWLDLTGDFHSLIVLTPLDSINNNQLTFNSKTLKIKLVNNVNLSYFDSQIQLPAIHVRTPEFQFAVNQVMMKNRYSHAHGYPFWVGRTHLQLANFFLHADGIDVQLSNLEFQPSSYLYDSLLRSQSKLAIEKLHIDGKQYSGLNLDFSTHNIDMAAYQQFAKNFMGIQASSSPLKQAQLVMLLPATIKMLGQGAVLDLNTFNIDTPDGKLRINAHIEFGKINNKAESMMHNLQTLLQQAKASVSLAIPRQLIADYLTSAASLDAQMSADHNQSLSKKALLNNAKMQAKKRLQQMLAKKVLVKKGNELVLDASYQARKFVLNGEPVQLPSLMR